MANIPVASIAAQLGVSKQTVYNWFTGAYNPQKTLAPAVEKLIAVIGTP
jgi:DNA-binding XRE family transcriptional regulator